MADVTPRPTLAEAIRSPSFVENERRLVAMAHRLILAFGGVSGLEPDDLVSTMVVVCLRGHRRWPEKMSLERYLGMVMLSVLRHILRDEARRRQDADGVMDERRGPSSYRDELIDVERRVEDIEEAIGDDLALKTMFELALEGAKRSEIAEITGWSTAQVDAARHRLNRRLDAAAFLHEDDDDPPRRARSPRKAPTPR